MLSRLLIMCLLLLSISLTACAQGTAARNSEPPGPTPVAKNSIQYLWLRAVRLEGRDTVELVRNEIRPGRLKKAIDISLHDRATDASYRCIVSTSRGELIVSELMAHPLRESVEFRDESTGKLARKLIEHQEREFLIRLPYDATHYRISFELLPAGGDPKSLSVASMVIN